MIAVVTGGTFDVVCILFPQKGMIKTAIRRSKKTVLMKQEKQKNSLRTGH